jgi:hypothetical protein
VKRAEVIGGLGCGTVGIVRLGAAMAVTVGLACGTSPVRVYLDRSTMPADLDPDAAEETLVTAVAWWASCGYDVAIDTDGARVWFGAISGDSSSTGQTTSSGGFALLGRVDFWSVDGAMCVDHLMLGNAMRHELDHLLGEHHERETWSVMYPGASVCEDRWHSETCHAP